jgi:hypothetical protein
VIFRPDKNFPIIWVIEHWLEAYTTF